MSITLQPRSSQPAPNKRYMYIYITHRCTIHLLSLSHMHRPALDLLSSGPGCWQFFLPLKLLRSWSVHKHSVTLQQLGQWLMFHFCTLKLQFSRQQQERLKKIPLAFSVYFRAVVVFLTFAKLIWFGVQIIFLQIHVFVCTLILYHSSLYDHLKCPRKLLKAGSEFGNRFIERRCTFWQRQILHMSTKEHTRWRQTHPILPAAILILKVCQCLLILEIKYLKCSKVVHMIQFSSFQHLSDWTLNRSLTKC